MRFLSLLAFDILTKWLAVHKIPALGGGAYPFGGFGVFSLGGVTFSLNSVVNTGAAWGVLSGYAGLLFCVRILIVSALVFFTPKRPAIWLIVTGAVGNLIDYCFYGHVIDFLHFTFWGYSFPIFNLADTCITLGVLGLMIREKKPCES